MSSLPGVTRLRDQHGALTRQTILRAARELFRERGYAASPVRLLAQRAGVAVQTIYDTYGSKAGVLAEMPDLIDEEAGVYELAEALAAAQTAPEILAISVRIERSIRERCGDILEVMRSAAAADPQLAIGMAEGRRRQRLHFEMIVGRIDALGALRAGLDVPLAAAICLALLTDETCDVLIQQFGWSFDQYETWVIQTLSDQLLTPEAGTTKA